MAEQVVDCAIIGAGPAGLTAAIYLKRYRRDILLIGDNQSRAALIPTSHNYPGFPEGISGQALLKALEQQLSAYDVCVTQDTIKSLDKTGHHFEIQGNTACYVAKKIILATGVIDIEPALPDIKDAVRRSLIRHCSICDAYEVIDHKIGVIGTGNKGIKEALFLKNYSSSITLLTLGDSPELSKKKLAELQEANIKLVQDPISKVILKENIISTLITQAGEVYTFDTLYSALGTIVRSHLAIRLGAKNINYYLLVNDHQETSVPGLYAIGDLVLGLNQLCVATGQAAIAATQIHSHLSK